PNGRQENWINLSPVLQKRYRGNDALCKVRCIQHRPLPDKGIIQDLKVIRTSHQPHAEWYIVLGIKTEGTLGFPETGLSCGIDPGLKTSLTLAGENPLCVGQDGCAAFLASSRYGIDP